MQTMLWIVAGLMFVGLVIYAGYKWKLTSLIGPAIPNVFVVKNWSISTIVWLVILVLFAVVIWWGLSTYNSRSLGELEQASTENQTTASSKTVTLSCDGKGLPYLIPPGQSGVIVAVSRKTQPTIYIVPPGWVYNFQPSEDVYAIVNRQHLLKLNVRSRESWKEMFDKVGGHAKEWEFFTDGKDVNIIFWPSPQKK